jgi:hypothetical protein
MILHHHRAELGDLCVETGQRRKPNRRGIFGDAAVAVAQDGRSRIAQIAKAGHGGDSLANLKTVVITAPPSPMPSTLVACRLTASG